MKMRILPLLLFSALQQEGHAHEKDRASFFVDKERGWFWREEIVDPVQPKPEKKVENSAELPRVAIKEPQPLSVAWLRKNLEKYRDEAIDAPSPENVAAYFNLQRVMMDKAHRFTDVAHEVVISDPRLDENVRRPISSFAVQAAVGATFVL